MNRIETRQLNRFIAFPFELDSNSYSYGRSGFGSLANEVVNATAEAEDADEDEKIVVAFLGKPGAGKTHQRKLGYKYLKKALALNNLSQAGFQITTYEHDGEVAARSLGRVTTDSRTPFTPAELVACDEVLEMNTYSHLIHGTARVHLLEIPAITSIPWGRERLGRQLGSQTFENLALREGHFADPDLKYKLFVSGCAPGIWPRVLSFYREEINNAETLQEAQAISFLFGKPPLRTTRQWEYRKREGASLEQIAYIEYLMMEMGKTISKTTPTVPYQKMPARIPKELAEVIPMDIAMDLFETWWREGHTIRFALERLGLPSENVVVTDNNPLTSDLGIPDIAALVKYLNEKNYFESLRRTATL